MNRSAKVRRFRQKCLIQKRVCSQEELLKAEIEAAEQEVAARVIQRHARGHVCRKQIIQTREQEQVRLPQLFNNLRIIMSTGCVPCVAPRACSRAPACSDSDDVHVSFWKGPCSALQSLEELYSSHTI